MQWHSWPKFPSNDILGIVLRIACELLSESILPSDTHYINTFDVRVIILFYLSGSWFLKFRVGDFPCFGCGSIWFSSLIGRHILVRSDIARCDWLRFRGPIIFSRTYLEFSDFQNSLSENFLRKKLKVRNNILRFFLREQNACVISDPSCGLQVSDYEGICAIWFGFACGFAGNWSNIGSSGFG